MQGTSVNYRPQWWPYVESTDSIHKYQYRSQILVALVTFLAVLDSCLKIGRHIKSSTEEEATEMDFVLFLYLTQWRGVISPESK